MDQRIKDIFLKKYRKTGVALTASQLLGYAKKAKLVKTSDLSSIRKSIHKFIREEVPELAPFARSNTRAKHYQTVGVSKPGVYFIDYAQFHKSWSGSNNRATGFLLAVENLTNKLFVLPSQGKDTRQWLDSIAKFIELTRDVQIIYSDRDSVAHSPKFKDEISQRYGLNWYFLRKGNKSFLAERYIGFVKTKLSQALASHEAVDKKDNKRWVDFIPGICNEYNNQIVPGTQFKRGSITKVNFDTFVGQLFNVEDPSLERYNSFKAGPFVTTRWNKACFKFDLGDKVLLARISNWKNRHEHGTGFRKVSHDGGFGKSVYTIAGRQLRANRSFDRFVPVYALAEFGSSYFHFYEHELSKVAGSSVVGTAGGDEQISI